MGWVMTRWSRPDSLKVRMDTTDDADFEEGRRREIPETKSQCASRPNAAFGFRRRRRSPSSIGSTALAFASFTPLAPLRLRFSFGLAVLKRSL